MDPYVVKFVEVLIMQVIVLGALGAILVAAVWDIVQAKVQESRRRDQIAPQQAAHSTRSRGIRLQRFAHRRID
jgi:hypothetical protein